MQVRRATIAAGVAALALVAAVSPAEARAVRTTMKAVASCTPKRVNVQYTDGSVHQVVHVVPGRRLRRVRSSTRNLFVVARIHASWARVTGGSGNLLRLVADGPASEQWTWRFRLRSAHPLADPTDYLVCLRPLAGQRSFVERMKQAPGRWTFTGSITAGRLTGSHGSFGLTSG